MEKSADTVSSATPAETRSPDVKKCPHLHKRIDGTYEPFGTLPRMTAWTCMDCHTSGATPWAEGEG